MAINFKNGWLLLPQNSPAMRIMQSERGYQVSEEPLNYEDTDGTDILNHIPLP